MTDISETQVSQYEMTDNEQRKKPKDEKTMHESPYRQTSKIIED